MMRWAVAFGKVSQSAICLRRDRKIATKQTASPLTFLLRVLSLILYSELFFLSASIIPSFAAFSQIGQSPGLREGVMSTAGIEQRGKNLKNKLSAVCSALIANGEVSSRGTDLSTIVSDYVPTGISFFEAESILRAAGFTFGPEPKPGSVPQSYAVVGVITTFNDYGPERFDLFVDLYPKSPFLFTIVDRITASFYVTLP
jgi:hypothetical protein